MSAVLRAWEDTLSWFSSSPLHWLEAADDTEWWAVGRWWWLGLDCGSATRWRTSSSVPSTVSQPPPDVVTSCRPIHTVTLKCTPTYQRWVPFSSGTTFTKPATWVSRQHPQVTNIPRYFHYKIFKRTDNRKSSKNWQLLQSTQCLKCNMQLSTIKRWQIHQSQFDTQ